MKSSFLKVLCASLFLMLAACARDETSPLATAGNDCRAPACVDGRLLHVPSPDWRDQIIYFVMIDRFNDGDPANNDQGVGEFDPSKESHYSGGDIPGITQKLDYVQKLGATALWLTPQVANLWWDPLTNYGGYHGYWARDFKSVDEHYGTLDDFKDLSDGLHRRGMYLVQDIVVNHVGNYFTYQGDYDPADVTKNFVHNSGAKPGSAPTQAPFHMVDVNNPEHRAANIYHWTPEIRDFSDPVQETTYQTGNLSDLNTSNPVVVDALKDSFGFWIRETGVDAFRIDTVKYVEASFYEDFLHGENGVYDAARATGRENFYTFGEVFKASQPLEDDGEKKLAQYVSSPGAKKIDAPIGFPLYKEIGNVFAGGAPTHFMSYRLQAQMRHFPNPHLVANFIDNHDVDRFLSAGTVEGFKLAYTLMMTIPGVPVIYQGDEQLFTHFRKSMFKGGFQGDSDSFDTQSDMYQFIQRLTQLRRSDPIFSRGDIGIVQDNLNAPGVLAYTRRYEGKVAYVVMNSAGYTTLANNLRTPFHSGNKAEVVFNHGVSESLHVDAHGAVTLVLPPQSAIVFIGRDGEIQAESSEDDHAIHIDNLQPRYENMKTTTVRGRVDENNARLLRVIDGNFDAAVEVLADSEGHWQFDLALNDLGEHKRTLEMYWPEKHSSSQQYAFTSATTVVENRVRQRDPKGDDKGPNGRYSIPTDATMGCYMDIHDILAESSGRVLDLSFTMCDVSNLWQPVNAFDHVSFTIFFSLPSQPGLTTLPGVGGGFPAGGTWQFAHVAYGWGNYLYSTEGVDGLKEGRALGLAPAISVNKDERKIRFRYDARHFGREDWTGVKIYATTWDKDGGGQYRNLEAQAAAWSFGGEASGWPKILDDAVLTMQPAQK